MDLVPAVFELINKAVFEQGLHQRAGFADPPRRNFDGDRLAKDGIAGLVSGVPQELQVTEDVRFGHAAGHRPASGTSGA